MKRVATQKVKEAVLNPLERRSPVEDTIKQATDEALYAAIRCRRNIAANELIRRYVEKKAELERWKLGTHLLLNPEGVAK